MAHKLDLERLQRAFQGRQDLIGAIQQAAVAPNWIELFNEITSYVSDLQKSSSSEPASKKRKLEESLPINTAPNGKNGRNVANGASDEAGAHDADEPPLLQIRDISFVMPQRKKYTLEFTKSYIRARHPETKDLIPGMSYAWKDMTYVFCLPVPEKTQKQNNYVLFPRKSNLPNAQSALPIEPLVFTIPATAPKPGTISGPEASEAAAVADDYKSLFDWALERALKHSGNSVKIVESDPKYFASVIKEPHRPTEKAVFVKGFRGSKDGYLFFLSTGILWGFKKPFLFLPKERIASVTYLSVLQRTFNMSVEVYSGDEGTEDDENREEFEFAMLDQEDFEGIDTYAKRHGFMDASMAEQRRAKRLGINVVKGEDGEKVDVGDGGELAKAEAELLDEEDEEEEDYEPGSEGESEGEGTSSEEEDEDGDGGGEAEDAEDDDDDDEEEKA